MKKPESIKKKLCSFSSTAQLKGGKLKQRSSTDWPFNNHVHKSDGAKLDLAHLTKTSLIFNLLEQDCLKV